MSQTTCLFLSSTGWPPLSRPMRMRGPSRSWRILTWRPSFLFSVRTRSRRAWCSSHEPWEKFMRATSMPERNIFLRVFSSWDEGPSVAMIFVFVVMGFRISKQVGLSQTPVPWKEDLVYGEIGELSKNVKGQQQL